MQKYFRSSFYVSVVKQKEARAFAHDSRLPSNGTVFKHY